jgi:hypothetical protein
VARYDDEDDDDIDIRRDQGPLPNYLVQAILATLFCCWPLGIVAIVKAANVNSINQRGTYAEALAASAEAKKWCWITFGCGLVAIVLYAAAMIIAAANDQNFR